MEIKKILNMVDHTLLKQESTWEQIKEICDDGMKYGTASVCIPPSFVKQAKEYVGDKLAVCTVIGFPNGYNTTAVKCFETQDAVKNGAVLVVAQHDTGCENQLIVEDTREAFSLLSASFFGNPSRKLRLVGITGTNGKTTTYFLLKSVFEKLGHKTGLVGTVKNIVGDKEYPANLTTPDPFELNSLFAEMVDTGCEFCVMEVSSQALAQQSTNLAAETLSKVLETSTDHKTTLRES